MDLINVTTPYLVFNLTTYKLNLQHFLCGFE